MQNLDGTGTTNDLTLDFSHNPASQIVTNDRSNNLYSFTGHANGNVADTVNGLNQLTTSGISHDGRGNVSAIGSASYSYDVENRLAYGHGTLLRPAGPAVRRRRRSAVPL